MQGEIRIHQSLIAPMLLLGVPRGFAIANGTIAAATILGLHSFWMLPVCIIIHCIAVMLVKKDVFMFQVIFRHLKQKNYYRV